MDFQTLRLKTARVLSVLITVGITLSGSIAAHADLRSLEEASYCSYIVPEGFVPGSDPGVYVNENNPLESANISYNVTEIPQDKVLTNSEKEQGVDPSSTEEELRYDELTEEMYDEIQRANYEDLYGANIGFSIDTFEQKEIDGFPSYHIKLSFTPENSQKIYQEVIMVLSSNRVFTIVYSRAEDDYFEEAFSESIDTIHVRKR